MSKYKRLELQFKNRESLEAALKEVGVPFEQAAGNTLSLYGYHGDERPERAAFVIRRANIGGSSNDMGFALRPDGSFEAIISEFDSGEGQRGLAILNRIKQAYGVNEVTRQARMRGYGVQRVPAPGGSIRLQLVKRS
ncbi:MAG TPA: DUF1257 domain-containing protein [Anaerolineales bacterium]|nr:DUF1257 domain-containing protein [Anaerolineales bacterium]